MTVDQIVSAIRALPVPERLRVIELAAHDAASDAPATELAAPPQGDARLTERHGLMLVDVDAVLPLDVFDHRLDRAARTDRILGNS